MKAPDDVFVEIEKQISDFANRFSRWGVEPLVEKARLALKREEQKVRPGLTPSRNPVILVRANEQRDRDVAWNQRAFKVNYLKWLEDFAKRLKELARVEPKLDPKAILAPFLAIRWDVQSSWLAKVESRFKVR